MAVRVKFCLVSSCKISHFGINPVKGGSPPRDRRTSGVAVVRIGALGHDVVRALIVVVLFRVKMRKEVEVRRR